ncbi:MAG TPA: hypothetical protein VJQ46_05175 [Gemmatimonadales bacterium]|nr:hypothetical protein [Gemmatimonadales bacterium]
MPADSRIWDRRPTLSDLLALAPDQLYGEPFTIGTAGIHPEFT